jgi:hypothetical protein
MGIKEYIKDIVREIISEEEIDEMSTSGAAGAYSTPFAFKGNKKGENAATKAAISQGFKKASTNLPKNSKVVDYRQLFEDEYEMVQDPKTKEFTKRVKLSDKDKETVEKIQALMAKEKSLKEGVDMEELEEMDEVSWNEKTNPTRGATMGEKDPKKVGQTTSSYAINEDEFKNALTQIKELKKELYEVNLLNARLLYTNKIFKSKNLNEEQKVKVLKAFDKVTSVKEAKLVFETLNEGMVARSIKTPSVNTIKGSASKAMGVIKENIQPIVEVDPMVARWQKLAGINKEI